MLIEEKKTDTFVSENLGLPCEPGVFGICQSYLAPPKASSASEHLQDGLVREAFLMSLTLLAGSCLYKVEVH